MATTRYWRLAASGRQHPARHPVRKPRPPRWPRLPTGSYRPHASTGTVGHGPPLTNAANLLQTGRCDLSRAGRRPYGKQTPPQRTYVLKCCRSPLAPTRCCQTGDTQAEQRERAGFRYSQRNLPRPCATSNEPAGIYVGVGHAGRVEEHLSYPPTANEGKGNTRSEIVNSHCKGARFAASKQGSLSRRRNESAAPDAPHKCKHPRHSIAFFSALAGRQYSTPPWRSSRA